MNWGPAVRTSYVLAAFIAAGTTGRTQTQESKSTAPQSQTDVRPASTEDSIATAKREFDAVKSLRDFGPQSKGGLPRIAAPELSTGVSPSLPGQKLKTLEGEKRQSNWLVDAMKKQTPARSGREDETRLPEQNLERPDPREENPRAGPENERKEQRVSTNPFARFLGDWMSPQDYTLLKPGLEQSFSSDASGPNGPAVASLGENFALKPAPGLESIGGFEPKSQPFGGTTTVRENPYLQGLASTGTGPPSVATVVKPVPALTMSPSASRGGLPSEFQTGASTPKPRIPEFVRPVADDKYFKPLKRF